MFFELAILCIVAAFAVLLVSTAFLEKQRIRDFVSAPPEGTTIDSPYFAAMNEAARRLGFTDAGFFAQDRRSRVYQARMTLWIWPDGQTLLRVGGGKTAGVPIRRSTLISLVEPNRIIETSDDFGMADLTGLTDRKTVLNAGLEELLVRHYERLAQCPGTKRSFSVREALTACEAIQTMKAAEMERLGLGRFVNRERTVWRHTLKGAWLTYYKGYRAQLAEGKAQQERINLKRPGGK